MNNLDYDPGKLTEIGSFLEGRARLLADQTVFYSELTKRFGWPPTDGVFLGHPLCPLFEALDEADCAADRPFRTALAISREKNRPADKFFKTIHASKAMRFFPRSEYDKIVLWKKEFDALIEFYKQPNTQRFHEL